MSTFASGPEPGEHAVPDASIVLPRYVLQVLRMVMCFNPFKALMPPALFLIVRSRPDT